MESTDENDDDNHVLAVPTAAAIITTATAAFTRIFIRVSCLRKRSPHLEDTFFNEHGRLDVASSFACVCDTAPRAAINDRGSHTAMVGPSAF